MANKGESKFLRVICARCGNRQTVYGKSSTKVKCVRCNRLLVKTGGGKVTVKTLVREVLPWQKSI